jgi:hypothetical protein
MVRLGALGRESVLPLILESNYPDISISVPDSCEIFPVNFLREFCEKSLRHSGFSLKTYLKSREIAKFPVNFPVTRELPMETGSYLTAHTTIADQ